MIKASALSELDYLRWIVESEHDMTVNHSNSTSEHTYKEYDEKMSADLRRIDELEEFIRSDCREIAERIMDTLCENGHEDLLLIKDEEVRTWWAKVQERRKSK